jgi:hypothetical protein
MPRTASSLPLTGLLTLGSDPARSRPGRQPATGPPGSYPDRTSTGRRRRAYGQQDPLLRHSVTSALLGARMIRARSPDQRHPGMRHDPAAVANDLPLLQPARKDFDTPIIPRPRALSMTAASDRTAAA